MERLEVHKLLLLLLLFEAHNFFCCRRCPFLPMLLAQKRQLFLGNEGVVPPHSPPPLHDDNDNDEDEDDDLPSLPPGAKDEEFVARPRSNSTHRLEVLWTGFGSCGTNCA